MHPRCFSLLLIALLASGMSVGWNVGLADELPADTNEIKSLTPEQAGRLSRIPLELDGLTTLDAETAKALADRAPRHSSASGYDLHLSLGGLITLDAAAAEALAGSRWEALRLDGLSSLPMATARALAAFKGSLLSLGGLRALDADAARAVAAFKGRNLTLGGLRKLDADAARALAAFKGGLTLRVTAFESPDSVAVAKALAAHKGPLKLPNLEKISPKTLTALITKDDVEIPLLQTLELIPEPDGGETEDFVIPKAFEERQRRQRSAR